MPFAGATSDRGDGRFDPVSGHSGGGSGPIAPFLVTPCPTGTVDDLQGRC